MPKILAPLVWQDDTDQATAGLLPSANLNDVADAATALMNLLTDGASFGGGVKGLLLTQTALDAPTALTPGSDGDVLTADSSTESGLAWAAPSAPAAPSFASLVKWEAW